MFDYGNLTKGNLVSQQRHMTHALFEDWRERRKTIVISQEYLQQGNVTNGWLKT